MNHIYIQTAFLGDLLLSIPSLRNLRYWSPKSSITLVCRKGYGSLMQELGVADEVIEVDKTTKKQLAQKLKGREFHTLFCPHQSYSSHQLVSSIKAEEKVGYRRLWNRRYFDKRVVRALEWPEAIRQLQLLAAVDDGLEIKMEAFAQKPDSLPNWAEMRLNNLTFKEADIEKLIKSKQVSFRLSEPFICIAPGSVWPTKRWTEQSFIKASTELVRSDLQVVILGAPDERALCERIQSNIPNSHSLAGQLSILQSIMLLSRSQGLICNDSGAMHMASLLHLPTLALFGPTVSELGYKPWNPKAIVLGNEDLLCRPCGQHGGRSCPIGTHRCMTDIPVRRVVETALGLFR